MGDYGGVNKKRDRPTIGGSRTYCVCVYTHWFHVVYVAKADIDLYISAIAQILKCVEFGNSKKGIAKYESRGSYDGYSYPLVRSRNYLPNLPYRIGFAKDEETSERYRHVVSPFGNYSISQLLIYRPFCLFIEIRRNLLYFELTLSVIAVNGLLRLLLNLPNRGGTSEFHRWAI